MGAPMSGEVAGRRSPLCHSERQARRQSDESEESRRSHSRRYKPRGRLSYNRRPGDAIMRLHDFLDYQAREHALRGWEDPVRLFDVRWRE